MNGPLEAAVHNLYQRAELAATRLPHPETPDRSLLAHLLAAIAAEGVADLEDLTTAVELYERDVQRRLNGNGGQK